MTTRSRRRRRQRSVHIEEQDDDDDDEDDYQASDGDDEASFREPSPPPMRSSRFTSRGDIVNAEMQHEERSRKLLPAPKGAILWSDSPRTEPEFESTDPVLRLDPRLPKPPFRMALVASMNSGKTTLIGNLLRNQPDDPDVPGYNGIFNRVLLVGPNILRDASWNWLRDIEFPLDYIHLTFSRDRFEDWMAEWDRERDRDIMERGRAPGSAHRVLVVFDDVLNMQPDKPFLLRDDSIADTRHGALSFIISGQRYNRLSVTTRTNLTHVGFWPRGCSYEQRSVIEDQCMDEGMSPAQVRKAFRTVSRYAEQPYQMVWIDKTKPAGAQLMHGLGGTLLRGGPPQLVYDPRSGQAINDKHDNASVHRSVEKAAPLFDEEADADARMLGQQRGAPSPIDAYFGTMQSRPPSKRLKRQMGAAARIASPRYQGNAKPSAGKKRART